MTEPEHADDGRRLLKASNDLSWIEDKDLEQLRERIRSTVIALFETALEELNRLPDPSPAQDKRRRAEAAWWMSLVQTMSRGLQ